MKKIISSLDDLRSVLSARKKQDRTTQARLAEIAGTSQSTISEFLAGTRTLPGRAVLRLQAFLLSEDGGENGEEQ